MSPLIISVIGLMAFFVLGILGLPVAFSFLISGVVGIILLKGLEAGLSTLGSAPYAWASQHVMLVVPLFVLMGQFAFRSGISSELYKVGYRWLGRFPGGLALATLGACTGFAACTGSALASAATIGVIAYPEMNKFNYAPSLSTGCIAAGGTLGILIPPSTIMIIYGFLTETSIGRLFIAGILPGLLISALFELLILVMCIRNPKLGPRGEPYPWKEMFASLTGVWGMLLLFALVLGGIYFGVFSPTEAGAIGAFGALVIVFFRGRLTWSVFVTTLRESLEITCFTLTILIGAMIFSTFLAVSGFPNMVSTWISNLPLPRYGVLICILFLYLPLGLALDEMAMVMLTVPIVFPVIAGLGFDPVWFGVLVVLLMELAMISPPVGITMFVIQGVSRVPMGVVFRGVWPFFFVMILGLAILVAFPQISLFLPNMMK